MYYTCVSPFNQYRRPVPRLPRVHVRGAGPRHEPVTSGPIYPDQVADLPGQPSNPTITYGSSGCYGDDGDDVDLSDEPLLLRAIPYWLSSMSTLRHRFVHGLATFAKHHPSFSWGSACSGTDLYGKCLRTASAYLESNFDIIAKFPTLMAVDKDSHVQSFLMEHFPVSELPVILSDIADLANLKATNKRTNSQVILQYPDAFAMGFSCLSKTPLNRNRSKLVTCVQDAGKDSTANTFEAGRAWIDRTRPILAILENVVQLDTKPADETKRSDGAHILAELSKIAPTADFNLQATDYGSWNCRLRKYFVSINVDGIDGNKALQHARRFLEAMRTEWQLSGDDVLLGPDDLGEYIEYEDVQQDASKAKSKKGECMWHDEHRVIFEHHNTPWPPPLAHGGEIDYAFMRGDGRMQECAYFYHHGFPVLEQDFGKWQNVDLQPTLSRSMGFNNTVKIDHDIKATTLRNPWSIGSLKTLTGSGRYLLRRKLDDVEPAEVRVLNGVEAMRALGWDLQYYNRDTLPMPPSAHEQLSTLAGRAFSGYVFTAVALASMSAIGLSLADSSEVVVATASEDDNGSLSD
jgi:site-specific DNA-cytosine methylase